MFNVFEEPWLLLTAALLLLGLGVFFGGSWSTQRQWWRIGIPIGIALLALGLDYFVRSDREEVERTIALAKHIVIDQDFERFDDVFAPDYSDRFHPSRDAFRRFAENSSSMADVERITERRQELALEETTASVDLSVMVRLESQGNSAYGRTTGLFFVEVRLHFSEAPSGRWLIDRADLLSVNQQPFNWGGVP